MKTLKGYIFSRPFLTERVPQHVQNIVNKNYCQKNNFNFLMSSTEYATSDSTHILAEILKNFKKYDGILFYSLLQLPEKKKIRFNFYKKIINQNKQCHFAVENLSIKKQKDVSEIEEIFILNQINLRKNENKVILGKEKSYVSFRHLKTKRNYLDRMNNNKVKCMKISKKYGKEYWDGDRKFGYGGYKYISGYYTYLAKKLIIDYDLNKDSKILDIGCGKGFLIFELSKLLNSKNIFGCDISKYAIKNSKKEIKNKITFNDAKKKFKFKDKEFDFVFSNTTLHNFKLPEIYNALREIERIGKSKYLCVESFRNEKEQFGVQCWALTAETLVHKSAWKWMFDMSGYTGDFEFIYFG
mgnify:CR=1 FL=1